MGALRGQGSVIVKKHPFAMPGFVSRTPFGLILRENTQAEAQAFARLVSQLGAQLSPAEARPLGPEAASAAEAVAQLRAMGGHHD